MLWQEKACHLLGTDQDKTLAPKAWYLARGCRWISLLLCHSQVVWDQFPSASCSTPLMAHLFLIYFFPSQSRTFDCGLWGCVSWYGQRNQLALTQIFSGLYSRCTSGVLWPEMAQQFSPIKCCLSGCSDKKYPLNYPPTTTTHFKKTPFDSIFPYCFDRPHTPSLKTPLSPTKIS